MAALSQAVRRLNKDRCDLCGQHGSDRNPLTRHHCDGDNKNNDQSNFMVVHRVLCHTFADFISQFYLHHGKKADFKIIRRAWNSFSWRD